MADKRAGGIYVDLGLLTANFDKSLKEVQRSLGRASRDFSTAGNALSKSFSLPLLAIGGFAAKAAVDYDKAFSTIRRKTGETGQQLNSLKKTFKEVFAAGDDSAAEVVTALTKVRVSTGASGDSLKSLTNTVLDLADVTEGDLNATVEASTKLLKNWQIGLSKSTESLDFVFKVSQKTGASFESLSTNLVKFGPVLRTFGFGFNEAAILIGSLEKKGVDVEKVLTGFQKVLPKLIENNIPLKAGFEGVAGAIAKAGDGAKGAEIALNAFGAKGGADLADALKGGRAEIDALTKSVTGSSETISGTAKDSETLGQRISKTLNSLSDALSPIGEILINSFSRGLDAALPKLADFAKYLKQLNPDTLNFAIGVSAIAAGIGPLLIGIGGAIRGVKEVLSVFSLLLKIPINPFTIGVAVAFGAMATAAFIWRDDLKSIFNSVVSFLKPIATGFTDVLAVAQYVFGTVFKAIFTAVVGYFSTVGDSLRANFSGVFSEIIIAASALRDALKSIFASIVNFLKPVGEAFTAIFNKIEEQQTQAFNVQFEKLRASNQKLKESLKETSKATGEVNKEIKATGDTVATTTPKVGMLDNTFKGFPDGVKKSESALKNLNQQLKSLETDALKESLQKAIASGDIAGFEQLKAKYLESVKSGTLAGLSEAVKNGGAEATKLANQIAEANVKKETTLIDTEFTDSLKNAHKESVDFWRRNFENAITGVKFNLEDMLKQVAVGFAAEIAAGAFKGLGGIFKGITSPQDLGGKFAELILGKAGGLSALFGGGQLQGPVLPGQAPLGSAGFSLSAFIPAITAAAAAVTAKLSISGVSSLAKGNKLNLGEQAALALPTFGTSFLFNSFLGDKEDPQRLAREAFSKIFGKDFDPGIIDFNTNWADDFWSKFQGKGAETFLAVGEGLKGIFGIESGVGEQFGALLAGNFGGESLETNLDRIKLLLDTMGVTTEQLIGNFFDMAQAGEISYLQFESFRDGLNQLPEEGLAAFGAFGEAFDLIAQAGNRGKSVLIQIKNFAIEAQQAGINSFESLRAELLSSGKSVEQVDALFAAFTENGINNIKELAAATDQQLGSIVGDAEKGGFKFEEFGNAIKGVEPAINKLASAIDKLSNSINGLPNSKTINVTTKYRTEGSKGASGDSGSGSGGSGSGSGGIGIKLANGGILSRATLVAPNVLAGEAGLEAYFPVSRKNGKLSIAGTMPTGGAPTIVFNVDARGAAPGVHADVVYAMSEMRDQILNDVVSVMSEGSRRGHF